MRILLAEDEVDLARALMAILKHNNYSVDVVHNGRDALDCLKSDVYDGVILDIMMPEVDGLTVLKRIRTAGNRVPVIILTAKTETDDKVAGLDAGADDYLSKPFSSKELLARLRAITRRGGEGTAANLTFGNTTLNTLTFMISGPLGEVMLTNKEFQMIQSLMMNPKNIISVEKFMEKIWGEDSETEQNVVWVYVSYLRRKLASIGSNAIIKAHRNAGYSLESDDK